MSSLSASAIPPALLCDANARTTADAGNCFHCGAPNPKNRAWRELVEGVPRPFCCAGCLAVAQTITAA